MKQLYWRTYGQTKHDLVLLHGWGLNAEVWHYILPRLVPHYRVHLVDLPGYGRSATCEAPLLSEMAAWVLSQAPEQAWWLGWSMGGLVSSYVALHDPKRLKGLITVASSPCFSGHADWAGIAPQILTEFQRQLYEDFPGTIARFLALQTLGSQYALRDRQILTKAVLSQPMPTLTVLNHGLEILRCTDLRASISQLRLPFLRIYGQLDSLVPRKVVPQMAVLCPQSQTLVIPHAAHAPFISHAPQVVEALLAFTCQ